MTIDFSQFSITAESHSEPADHGFLKVALSGLSEAIPSMQNGMNLVTVVGFQGQDNAGHYFAYRLHKEMEPPFAKRWVSVNDSRVAGISAEEVLDMKAGALLLSYENPI
jgi:ubiquitin C-terminal hydrolase